MIQLPEAPRLMWPTVAVQTSYLVGEQADCLLNGTPANWLGPASEDFVGFVAERRGVRTRWGVPSTIFWYRRGRERRRDFDVYPVTRELGAPPAAVATRITGNWVS